jgi:hypothetical protein
LRSVCPPGVAATPGGSRCQWRASSSHTGPKRPPPMLSLASRRTPGPNARPWSTRRG